MPVWGRDELQAGEMWNSNSLISWPEHALRLDVEWSHFPSADEPTSGRAGTIIARRQQVEGAYSPPSEATHPAHIPQEVPAAPVNPAR